jgi:hypothetical protein
MSNYRIKIEEKNNGEKGYIPQVCKLQINRRLFRQTQELVWYNIHYDPNGTTFSLSKTIGEKYNNEEDALKVIEDYRNKYQIEEGDKIKSTTYKMVD